MFLGKPSEVTLRHGRRHGSGEAAAAAAAALGLGLGNHYIIPQRSEGVNANGQIC